ncbi:LPXTG cell wall anchor domain-containing protein [Staphylococcus simiae]|uniref:Gram-positive cocci surface proteins LPxTG domain-containing protein n=1 Tax=Staphylococcus simiae CCM 7213 = CCUG 51256 TaxID=911238 RepID=G5JI33_9STAP|nr:LPXTG cell wall anchor domain-containing protein [Staphylococcus simiae]EHJ08150.1 hypothetical protein SS7213T_05576 [Staphylococcus simiae CCM 7213 = CCUG 51256]SNV82175.1 LPXTG-motif surface-anchored protein [Staphylococcus simiae]
MKKISLLTTTTLAGALLFTGIEAGHQAKADTIDTIKIANQQEWQYQHDKLLQGRLSGQSSEGGGVGAVNSYDNSYQEYYDHALKSAKEQGLNVEVRSLDESKEQFKDDPNANFGETDDQQTMNQQTNKQQVQNNTPSSSTVHKAEAQSNIQQTDDTKVMKALPETGDTSSSNSLIAVLASTLMAIGSVLTFKRLSKNK